MPHRNSTFRELLWLLEQRGPRGPSRGARGARGARGQRGPAWKSVWNSRLLSDRIHSLISLWLSYGGRERLLYSSSSRTCEWGGCSSITFYPHLVDSMFNYLRNSFATIGSSAMDSMNVIATNVNTDANVNTVAPSHSNQLPEFKRAGIVREARGGGTRKNKKHTKQRRMRQTSVSVKDKR